MRTSLFVTYSPWISPIFVFALTRLRLTRPIAGYLMSAIVSLLFVDLIANPQIFKGTFLHKRFFHESWFNPNVSSVALALFTFLIPRILTFDLSKNNSVVIYSKYLDVVLFVAIILSASIIGLFTFSLSILVRYRNEFYNNKLLRNGTLLLAFVFTIFNISHLRNSIEVRLSIWRSALRMLNDHLLFGVGPGNFRHFFLEYREDKLTILKNRDLIQIDPHNLILNLLLSFGLIATLLLITMFLLYAIKTKKVSHKLEYPHILLIVFLIQAMVNVNSFLINSIFVLRFINWKSIES